MVSYDELSTLMGTRPDLAIVRRFGSLAGQVILRMQAELSELEDDLKELGKFELKHPELRGHAKSWEKANETIASGGRSLRQEKILEVDEKLGKYCTWPSSYDVEAAIDKADEFVTRTASVMRLGSPDSCDINFLRGWLQNEKCGDNFLKMSATAEATAWDANHTDDLMSLNKRPDRFAAWVANQLVPVYHRLFGHRWQKRIDDDSLGSYYAYDDQKMAMLGNVLCTVLSTLIPSSSILVLYYVKNMLTRLLLIIGFSSLFSFVMGFVARGHRYEIFAATLAFAAVQVVFVGGVTGKSNN
ncbi:hypothetical protein H2200_010766 [Cladophialophora chaetospira]|uniref:DUF6594 domain-containing protein n=1 Tax=Cladophialophora chaetospira TaxID=386627 RepID=A0AA38X0V3_9EURO|nr:hypothetical protein H2200_010766 [Cladophialophora chaetospira]